MTTTLHPRWGNDDVRALHAALAESPDGLLHAGLAADEH